MANEKIIEAALNELIAEAVKGDGFVYLIDQKDTNFVLKLTNPVRIQLYKGETYED